MQPPGPAPEGLREAVEEHYVHHLGPDPVVWHERESSLVHLDVYAWEPTDERPFHTLATLGMSERRMSLPLAAVEEGLRSRAELLLCLPPDWPVPRGPGSDAGAWGDEAAYFPVRALKQLARMPHMLRTWLGRGHTVPQGKPFAPGSALTGWLVMPPTVLPAGLYDVETPAGYVACYGVIGLTGDELAYATARGTDALLPFLAARRVSELLDVRRPSSLES